MLGTSFKKFLLLILGGIFLIGISGCATYKEAWLGEGCTGFADWDLSFGLDTWFGSDQNSLIMQYGPPDEKVPDQSGGQYFIYNHKSYARVEFDIDAKGKVIFWQWQRPNSHDNMNGFVSYVQEVAFTNNCNGSGASVPLEMSQEAMAKAASYGFPFRVNPNFDSTLINLLGTWYSNGIHFAQDKTKGFHLFDIAAVFNDPDAQENLGDCYRDGMGVRADVNQARYWYQLAANQGDQDAANKLASLK